MSDKPYIKNALENIPGGFLIYRADYDKEEIIFANQKLIDMFECENYEDFLNYTHGSFKGVVCDDDYQAAENQIKIQINSGSTNFDHIQYHVITKTGRVLYVEDFGQYVVSEDEGPLFYVYIVDIETKSLSYDIDHVTGLPGDRRFVEYASRLVSVINRAGNYTDFAVIYINLVGFKHFNLKYGFKEGNTFLREFAEILNDIFSTDLVARLSDNNFAVFATFEGFKNKLARLHEVMSERYAKEKIVVKSGIYVLGEGDNDHFDLAIDNARAACHDASDDSSILYKIYDSEMKKERELFEYVTTHFDEACENGWIVPYFQPVVRTLTNQVASMEALARWVDPKYGFLAPYKFIGPLESTKQIHKLDTYMIKAICKKLRELIDNNEAVVPISFNLSRHDFMLTNAYELVSSTCAQYEIPHRLIKIEITETTVIEDPDAMTEIINKFRDNGFEIWMDDFGSGYSSLNILKNFDFDEIKLDMIFLSEFTEKAKDIIISSIVMAQKIGIKTLAEGVETKEQLEFLKSIGCEKVQGYYYSKPLPYEELIKVLKEKNIELEPSRFHNFYDNITGLVFVTDQPVCLIYDDGESFRFRFKNEAFNNFLKEIGLDNEKIVSDFINNPKSLFRRTVRNNSSYMPENVGEEVVFFYTFVGNYIRFRSKNVGCIDNHKMFWIRVDNLTSQDENIQRERLESSMRDIYHIYDSVGICDLSDDSFDIIVTDPISDKSFLEIKSLSDFVDNIKMRVYPKDADRIAEFLNPSTIKERVQGSENGYIMDAYRFIDSHHETFWKNITVLSSSGFDDKYLILGRRFTKYENEYFDSVKKLIDINETEMLNVDSKMDIYDIFNAVVNSSDRYFFWKDKDRRFLGASRAFLDVYGLKSASEIIGKTDEDVGWNVTELEYMNDELDVIKKGKTIRNVVGNCIIRGVPHNIACSKWPVYNKGKIVGLFGYFVDLDKEEELLKNELGLIDRNTNLLNGRGFAESLLSYISETKALDVPFLLINIKLTKIDEITQFLGLDVAQGAERAAANVLREKFGMDTSISHMGYGKFVILRSYLEPDVAISYCKEIEDAISSITEANGIPLTLYAKATFTSSDDVGKAPEKLLNIASFNFDD